MSTGIRNPKRSVFIALGLTLLAGCAIAWGFFEMDRLDAETPATGAAIGFGLLVAILGFFLTINFVWAARLVGAMRRGEGVIACWTVPSAQFDDFRTSEAAHKAAGRRNDYKIPRKTPAEGVEIVFTANAVLIGDTFFGLARDGIARFTAARVVSGNPPCLVFATAMTVGRTGSSGVRFDTYTGELRVPNGAHFQAQGRPGVSNISGPPAKRRTNRQSALSGGLPNPNRGSARALRPPG